MRLTCTCVHSEGSYSWTETVWNTAGNLYYNTNFGEKTSFFIQLQICGNVSNIKYKSCNVTSPVYLVSVTVHNCACIHVCKYIIICM